MSTGSTRFDLSDLIKPLEDQADAVKKQLEEIKKLGTSVGVGDMFTMQMMVNKLSQLSEMTGALMSAQNSSVMSLARNVKG